MSALNLRQKLLPRQHVSGSGDDAGRAGSTLHGRTDALPQRIDWVKRLIAGLAVRELGWRRAAGPQAARHGNSLGPCGRLGIPPFSDERAHHRIVSLRPPIAETPRERISLH